MLKKYGYHIIALVAIIATCVTFFVYTKVQNNIKEHEAGVRIYEENQIKIKEEQQKVEQELRKAAEKKAREDEEAKKPKAYTAAVPIFMYHFIRDDVGDYPYPENMVKVDALRAQIKYIKENNFDPVFISDFDKLYKYKKPVALTFDDGWEDFYINAFPIIKEHNVKVSLYVVDKFFTTPGYCNIAQLKEIKESGLVDIQAHSMTHPYLSKLSKEKISDEVVTIKDMMKEKLDIEPTVFCYPFGDRNQTVLDVTKANYKYALDMDGGVYYTNKHDNYKIPRIYANRSMTLNTFISYLNKANVQVVW